MKKTVKKVVKKKDPTARQLERRINSLEKQLSKASKPKAKRKPSAYNLHVQKVLKNGGTLADAAKTYKGGQK